MPFRAWWLVVLFGVLPVGIFFFFKLNHCSFFLVTACLVSFLLITSKYKPAISCVLNLLFRGFSFSLFDLYTKDLNFDIVEFINFVDENPVP